MACNFYDSDSEASHLAEIEDEDYLCEVNSYILNFEMCGNILNYTTCVST